MYINLKLYIFLFITSVSCQQCSFEKPDGSILSEEDIKYGIVLPSILDTEQPGNKSLLTYRTTGVTKIIRSTTASASQRFFITPTFDSNILNVTLANDFKDYEIYETKEAISIRVYFECTGGTETNFEIIQPITDTNNHDPQFVNAPYRYKLSMPLPKNIPLHLLSGIAARDIDLSNRKITFFLNNSDVNSQGFFASWLSTDQTDTKLHRASLMTTAVINLKNDFSFNIYARDNGTEPRTVSTSVTIIVDKDNSVLRFEKLIYIADYSDLRPEVANGTIFTFEQGDILLSAGADNSVEFFLHEESQEYQDNFYLIKKSDASVELQLINPPKKIFNESFVLLTLNASKPGADDITVIHISFPGRSASKNSSISSTEATKTDPYNDDSSSTVPTIVLGVFLAIVTIGFVVMIVLYWRRTRSIVTEKVNGIQEKKEEMMEIDKDSPHPVSSARRSVAFNDIVEEIKIAKL